MTVKETGSSQPRELRASVEFQVYRGGIDGDDLKEVRNLEEDEQVVFPATAKRPIRAKFLGEVEVRPEYPARAKVTLKQVVRLQYGTNVLGVNEQGQTGRSPLYLQKGDSANFVPFTPKGGIPDIPPSRITHLREDRSPANEPNKTTSARPSQAEPSGFPPRNAAIHHER